MNKSKLKIASYLLLIFLAGGVSGGSIAWKFASTRDIRPPHPGDRKPGFIRDILLNEWKEKIGLTEEQITRIRPILELGMKEVRALQESSVQQVRATMKKTDGLISEELSPEQKIKFEEWQRERDERHSKHRFGPGPRHGPGGKPPETP